MKVLICNRGEIALRILKATRSAARKIPTLVIYTEQDATTLPVLQADESVLVSSYLNQSEIIKIALENKCTMICPGYGFLSENADFALAVESSGIQFCGPSPVSIRSLGLKHEARALAISAQVPCLPGSEVITSLAEGLAAAEKIGYPVMIKSSGGGGGMGMVDCKTKLEFEQNFESVVSQSKSLFSNDQVFIEKFIPRARHLECQIFGDGHGAVVSYGIRECSVQRRNQKVLEESLSESSPISIKYPDLLPDLKTAALSLAKSLSYRSAGTVEFLCDEETGSFYFLEVNARIQVEHCVTEMVHPGLDLVGMMLDLSISQMNGLEFNLPEIKASGYAIEARIYAEIPHLNFKPCPGALQLVKFPKKQDWLRIETWVESGSFISPLYDPMAAKIITFGSTRKEARERLISTLEETVFSGVQTNRLYLLAILASEPFAESKVFTKWTDGFTFTPNCLEILDGGLSCSIQDGRPRVSPKGDGIPRGGPDDWLAFRVANLLASNPPETELIEITSAGISLSFTQDVVVGITGGQCEIYVISEGEVEQKRENWSRINISAGSTLEIGACETGNRVYLAIQGELDVPLYMGSKSTFPGGQFGGHQGRDLLAGDVITILPSSSLALADLTLPKSLQLEYSKSWKIAALPGPHGDQQYLTKADLASLFSSTTLTITIDSNRSGSRIDGLPKLKFSRADGEAGGGHPSNVLDHGYSIGMVNMNGDTPVVFAIDAPDSGGFACVITVPTIDWWKLGQIQAGDSIQFVETNLELIELQRIEQENWISNVKSFLSIPESVSDYPRLEEVHLNMDPSLSSDGVLLVVEADESKSQPKLSYRQAGDGSILVEVGNQTISFAIRVYTELWESRIRELNITGLECIIQGSASIIIKFDPTLNSTSKVLNQLVSAQAGGSLSEPIKARRVYMPMVFDDLLCRLAIEEYMVKTGRKKSIYLPSNIDYFKEILATDDVLGTFLKSDWYVTARAFFCGLPFLLPIDQRACLAAQKFNPSRTNTPKGALGFAGSTAAIYPVESPGGYMLFGRTLSTWNVVGGEEYEDHFLLKSFDTVRWLPMSEEEFIKIEKDYASKKYTVRIEEIELSPLEIFELEESTRVEVQENIRQQRERMMTLAAEEEIYLKEWNEEKEKKKIVGVSISSSDQNGTPLKSPVHSICRSINCKVGDILESNQILATLEAMKTQIDFKVSRKFIGKTITSINVNISDNLIPGQALFYCN